MKRELSRWFLPFLWDNRNENQRQDSKKTQKSPAGGESPLPILDFCTAKIFYRIPRWHYENKSPAANAAGWGILDWVSG